MSKALNRAERRVVNAAMRYFRHVIATQSYMLRFKCAGTETRLKLLAACKSLAKSH